LFVLEKERVTYLQGKICKFKILQSLAIIGLLKSCLMKLSALSPTTGSDLLYFQVEENLFFYADRNLWTESKKGQEKIGLDGPVIKAWEDRPDKRRTK
jgi:hypothetical protein